MKENKEYITLYVADDGKSFRVKSKCERYEREKEKDTCRKELLKYRILLPNPIVPDTHYPNADFVWFDVKNDDVYNLISLSYDKRYPNLESELLGNKLPSFLLLSLDGSLRPNDKKKRHSTSHCVVTRLT